MEWTPDSDDPPPQEAPQDQVRKWFNRRILTGQPIRCPTCDKHAEMYHRALGFGLIYILVTQYHKEGQAFVHTPSVVPEYVMITMKSGKQKKVSLREGAKLAWWGLMEEEKRLRPDGGRAGFWRVTDLAVQFIEGNVKMPSHCWEYQGWQELDRRRYVTCQEALGKRFDLDALLRGEW